MPNHRRVLFLDLLPTGARFLRKGDMLWRPDSKGYTFAVFDAGVYLNAEVGDYRGHSKVLDPSDLPFTDGTPGAIVLDEVSRLRDALGMLRRSHHAGPAEFARRVLAGEPPDIAKGCLAPDFEREA